MKQIRCYLPNVLLTFLLVFFLLATQLTIFAKTQVLNAANFQKIAEQEGLADMAYSSLETYFKIRANSTGIPAEVYTDVMDRDALHEAILGSVSQAFDYLNGKTDTYEFTMDFTALEDSVSTFFSDYAAENNVQKDAVYEEKVTSVIAEAEAEILFVADTFKFSTMHKNGWLETARTLVSYLNLAQTACIIGTAVLVLLLILCNLKQPAHLLYWGGLSWMTASLLLLVPCIYVTATDYFAGFAIKDPQIFAAVVGFLELLVSRATTLAIMTLILSVVALAAFGLSHALQREKEAEKTAE